MRMTSPVTWDGANCTDMPTDGFYPAKGTAQVTARNAKAVCNGTDERHEVCRWRSECLEYAIARNERFGVWGGMSERDRWKEKRRRREEQETEQGMGQVDRVARAVAKKAAPAAPKPRKAEGMLGRWADTKKTNQRLLPKVQQHLLARPQGVGRAHDVIHVSELVKPGWCPRATYMRISTVRSGVTYVEAAPSFQLDNIFEEGNRIHDKWRTWWWDMGVLWGLFECTLCGYRWHGQSPAYCADTECSAGRASLRYAEVPMFDQGHLVTGHADAEIRDGDGVVLVECKSIGVGTVRAEQPKTLGKYTRTYEDETGPRSYVDHDALWRDLRRPFPSHLRQGLVYLYLRQLMTELHGWPEVKRIVFVYEYKPTQAVKEFAVSADHEWVGELMQGCKDIVYALDNQTPPSCKDGRKLCAACRALEPKDHDAEQKASTLRGNGTGTRESDEPVLVDASTPGRGTLVARRPDRTARRRANAAADAPHSLGGLLRGAVGDGGRR